MEKQTCHITKKLLPISQLVKGSSIVSSVFSIIKNEYPDFSQNAWIEKDLLHEFRGKYLESLVKDELGAIHEMEKEVLAAIQSEAIITEKLNLEVDNDFTFGERLSDKIAEFGGSWAFILSFLAFMFIWICANVFFLMNNAFDPFPFILLNLILSCLAALQAPIIMMSQNRQEQKDRKRAENDYKTNLKAELEIRQLHDKIDHLIQHQNKKIMEIQEIQSDYLNEIVKYHRKND